MSWLGVKTPLTTVVFGKWFYSLFRTIFIKDSSVNISGLKISMKPVFDALARLGISKGVNFVITSGNDANHKLGSYHYEDRAIDISFKCGLTNKDIPGWADGGEVFQSLNKMLNPLAPSYKDYDIILEADHVHIEYDPGVQKKTEKTSGQSDSQKENKVEEIPISYLHTDPTITTLSDLISKNPLFKGVKQTDLENLKGPDGLTNKTRIENSYVNPDEDAEEKEEWPTLKVGTMIYVMPSMLQQNVDFLSAESSGQVKKFRSWGDYVTETQSELNELAKQGKYVPAYIVKSQDYNYSSLVKHINSFFRVWIYSKVANAVVDITAYCKTLVTFTQTSNDDQFSIELVFVNPIENWNLVKKSKDYDISEGVVYSDSFLANRISLFCREISENDIVFLSFEQLLCEDDYREGSSQMVEIDRLHDQFYDFIGLVSTVQQSSDAQGSGLVTITGQSLVKMFNDDEAVFRPISAIESSLSGNLLIGDRQKRGWTGRFFADGEYHSLFTATSRTIERTLKFYLNLVSNVGLLPLDEAGKDNNQIGVCQLFSSWGGERTKLWKVDVDEKGRIKELQEDYAKGIYQIVKLQVDSELGSRHLADGTVSNPEGTIMSLLRTTCQFPLVELIMDTYKNTFDIICRVPPFGKKAILEWIESSKNTIVDKGKSFHTIEITDVASESLSWETNFYTWFELHPKGTIVPIDDLVPLCYIPTLFLTDFIDVWGSRRLSVVSPYSVMGSGEMPLGIEIKQALQDLCWLVESHFYLPFTRKGTITLAVPDRRFKKGQWVRYNKTGEIFYIDGVQQSVAVSSSSVSRQTVLSVSRGLVEKYITTKNGDGYFDIIDFDKLAKGLEDFNENDIKNRTSKAPAINSELFRFFCGRKQFIK